jgi:hypothetical protein
VRRPRRPKLRPPEVVAVDAEAEADALEQRQPRPPRAQPHRTQQQPAVEVAAADAADGASARPPVLLRA